MNGNITANSRAIEGIKLRDIVIENKYETYNEEETFVNMCSSTDPTAAFNILIQLALSPDSTSTFANVQVTNHPYGIIFVCLLFEDEKCRSNWV